jgi:GcrA cell cycle regulator
MPPLQASIMASLRGQNDVGRNNPNEFAWTDAAVKKLMALWSDGLSASECGKRIGVSRNSVIGKVHRLGLSGKYRRPRKRAPRMRARPNVKKRSPPVGANFLTSPPEMPKMRPDLCKSYAPPLPEEPRRGNFDLLELKLGQCRYPEGSAVPFRFCGAPIADGYPYCLEHAELCYNKPVSVRSAA